MAEKRDYYEVLGLSKGCNDDELKKAYRKKAKEYHPDLNPGDNVAESKFKEVNEAYEILSDSGKKAQYDQFGHVGVDPSAGGGAGYGGGFGGAYSNMNMDFDLGDIFESVFGGGFGGGGRRQSTNAPQRGADLRKSMTIDFMDACKGVKKEVTLNPLEKCSDCGGSGAQKGTSVETCAECGGSGQVRVSQRTPFGTMASARTCSRCGGKGKTIKSPCGKCSGTGNFRKRKTIEVEVPAGIDDGQTLSVRGAGDSGTNGASSGDLNITFSVRPDPLFVRKGFDIWIEIPITYAQAVMGAELTVPTIDGKVTYNIPEGTQPGTVFRLKTKGVPHVNSSRRGDQYVEVFLEVPKHLSRSQKAEIKEHEENLKPKNFEKRKSFIDKMEKRFS